MDGESIRILLIEDNPLDVYNVREMLTRTAGASFTVEDVGLLLAGLERLAEGDIDVVLLNLSLPDSHGLETFVQVHAQSLYIPIIVLSATENEVSHQFP
jgi:CheY-like chemotaxis protein